MTSPPNQNPAAVLTEEHATGPGSFASLLFDGRASGAEQDNEPDYFVDLNLGQVVISLCNDREFYNLAPFFFTKAPDLDTVAFRHEVFRDLQDEALLSRVKRFAEQMQQMRTYLHRAKDMHYTYQKEGLFLEAVATYCDAVTTLSEDLTAAALHSRGLRAFRQYLATYVASPTYQELATDTAQRRDDLSHVVYQVNVRGGRVTVSRYEGEPDYSAEIEKTFDRFKQGAVKDYRVKFRDYPEMNHVEAQILEFVAKLFPEVFEPLGRYCAQRGDFRDPTVAIFDREVQFYVSYLDHLAPFVAAGLSFCFPEVTDQSKEVFAKDTFDLALANKLLQEKTAVVCNEFFLHDPERIFVVSGPNQGGKTTFARTFGQVHHLANIGCLVPGSSARLFFFDQLFTQFEKEEDLDNLSGKLENDLVRVHRTLDAVTPNSMFIMNEVFSSTTLYDARFLGRRVLERIIELDVLCVYVSFIDELASMPKTVSMISTIVPEDPAERTFHVVRGPANGLAYALAIAEKYEVTYERLKERINR